MNRCLVPFSEATCFINLKIIYFLECWRNEWQFSNNYRNILTKNWSLPLIITVRVWGPPVQDMEKKLFRIPDPCLGVKKAPDPRIKIVLVTCILILSDSALYETKLNLIPLSADAQLCRLLKKVIEKHTLHLTASVYLRLDWYRKKI